MRIKALDQQAEWDFFKEKAHAHQCEDTQGIVALGDDGSIKAVLVADSFSRDSCNVHMAIGDIMVLRHNFLHEGMRHIFETCGRSHIFGRVPSDNAKALKFDKHIGFTEVCRIPDGVCTGTDYIILRMDKADCRWITHHKEAA